MQKTTLTLNDFAELVGISKRFTHTLTRRGDAPLLVRLGRRVLIRREAAERWLMDQEQGVDRAAL